MSSNPVVPSPDNGVDPSNVGALPLTPQPQTQSLDTPPAPSGAARPGLWADVLKGALNGLSGVAQTKGRGSFGVGLAQGVQGETAAQQRDLENQTQQQQLQFQSAQAAASLAEASKRSQLYDQQITKGNVDLAEQLEDHAANVAALNRFYGLPDADVTISAKQPADMHAQAGGALQTLAAQNGGTVPRVVTVDQPAHPGNDSTHTVDAYATPNAQDLSSNGSGYLKFVNDVRAIDNLPALSDQDWRTGQGSISALNPSQGTAALAAQQKWQAKQVSDAQAKIYPVPTVGNDPSKNDATIANLQQTITNYGKRSDANPAIQSALQSQLDSFNSAAGFVKDSNQTADAAAAQAKTVAENSGPAAAAKAQSAKQEQLAKETTPGGQLDLAAKGEALQEKRDEDVVAFDPSYQNSDGSKGGNVVMPRGQAEDSNLQHYKVDASQVNSIVAGFNDVQNKLNQLATVTTDPSKMSKVQPGVAADLIAGYKNGGVQLGISGIKVNMDNPNAQNYASQLSQASDETKQFVVAYNSAHEAVTQLPRLQTFGKSSRMSQQQVEAALNLLPAPGDDPGMAQSKMQSLQTMIDPLRKQVPHMPGGELTPSWLEQNNSQALKQAAPGIQNAIHGVYNPQTRSIDPFAGIDTRALLNGGQ